jgi:ATP-dependent Clp protease ATP-binding subunit ClpA
VYGARPLKRLIQRQIADRLALALLEGNYQEGSTVTVDAAAPVMAADGSIDVGDGLILR